MSALRFASTLLRITPQEPRMNRTAVILCTAGALLALALVAAPSATQQPTHPTQSTSSTLTTSLPAVGQPVAAPVLAPTAPSVATAKDGVLRVEAKLASGYAANGNAPNYLTVDIQAAELETQLEKKARAPVNLAVVIDRSGSMAGEKLLQAKRAAHHLVSLLTASDRLAIVHYGSDVKVFHSERATPVAKRQMTAFIDGIEDSGSTNISEGLRAGESALVQHLGEFRTSRVILLSDGQPTDGETSREGLNRIVRDIRQRGLTVTSLGVGSDFDEVLMRGLAESGGGFYGYLADAERLAEVFGRELDQATSLVARDVVLSFDVPAGVRVEEVLGHSVTQAGNRVAVRLYDFSAGLSARVVARLSVSSAPTAAPVSLGNVVLAYRDLQKDAPVASSVGFSAIVTPDAKLALTHADPQLLEHAARAEAAKHMEVAATHFREGRTEEAYKTLDFGFDNVRKLFGSSADALAGDMKVARGANGKDAAKSLDTKSMKMFGENNAY